MKTMELKSDKLYVGLGSTIDFSRWDSFSRNERIDELYKPDGLVYFEVSSLKEAVDLTQKFIKQYRLGASNWTGGIVLDISMNFLVPKIRKANQTFSTYKCSPLTKDCRRH